MVAGSCTPRARGRAPARRGLTRGVHEARAQRTCACLRVSFGNYLIHFHVFGGKYLGIIKDH
jgi:hypothetical protein